MNPERYNYVKSTTVSYFPILTKSCIKITKIVYFLLHVCMILLYNA